MNGNIYIGTSGWVYKHWESIFYPQNLPSAEWLNFYSQNFSTTEINNSFYHLPAAKTFRNWRQKTPQDFLFSVKVSRYITHVKRLKDVKSSWNLFLRCSAGLKDKLGPLLLQFPSSFAMKEETIERLDKFLAYAKQARLVFEFRNESWFSEEVYEFLRSHQSTLVIANSSVYPQSDVITGKFVYVRMHGPKALFSSDYPLDQIKTLGESVNKWSRNGYDVYVYFNNDFGGFALKNAKELMAEIEHKTSKTVV